MIPPRRFHFSAMPLRRSLAKSAAYVMGTTILDGRTGIASNFSRRGATDRDEIVFADLLLPGERKEDIGLFVNRVMRKNNKPRAVFGRSITAAIPACLSEDDMRRYVAKYAKYLVERYGVGVIVAIHRPPAKRRQSKGVLSEGGEAPASLNWHVHFILSYCTVDEHGVLGRKQRLFDPTDCVHMRVQSLCDVERPRWAEATNEALSMAGFTIRVDHRSLVEQGSMDLQTRYRGPTASSYPRPGMRNTSSRRREPEVIAYNRNVVEHNARRREKVRLAIERLQQRRERRVRILEMIERMIHIESTREADVPTDTTDSLALVGSSAPINVANENVTRSEGNRWWQTILSEGRRLQVQEIDWRLGVVLFTDGGVIARDGFGIMQMERGDEAYADDLLSDVRHLIAVSSINAEAGWIGASPQFQRVMTAAERSTRTGDLFTDDRKREIDAKFGMLRPCSHDPMRGEADHGQPIMQNTGRGTNPESP